MKVSVMGQQLTEEEVAEIPEAPPELTAYFEEPTVSVLALDTASRVVPEEVWRTIGLATWLRRRANEAFKKMPVHEKRQQLNRLIYVFEYINEKPVLKNVILT